MVPKTLPTIWYTYVKLVTKYQISAINSCWEKCDEKYFVFGHKLHIGTPYHGKQGRIQRGAHPARARHAPPLKLEKIWFFGVKSWFFTRNTPKFSRLPSQLEKRWFFGVKSWFFTRNTPKMFAPPSARRNFFKNWWGKFMFILKLVVDTKSAPRLEGKRKQKKNAKLYRRLYWNQRNKQKLVY
jgi:hypothetical protein